ncbi:MAG: hypothetical protein QM751_07910 [Paludibacteraceae bacterium]
MRYCYRFILSLCIVVSFFTPLQAQSTFPSVTWSKAQNLSSVLPTDAYELSGLYWNDSKKQLFIVCDGGKLIILSLNTSTNTFSLTANINNMDSPEGITQVDNTTNEFYTIDEGSYQIRKYGLATNYATVTLMNSWNILSSPSPMTDTGNTGPEGITFVPDWFLKRIGFVSSVTGKTYSSTKGMNGLIFIAHQSGGYVWVFDLNPAVSDDFLYVGKYKTAESESCDVAFDYTTGLMYILHNTGSNYLEVTDLSTTVTKGEYTFNTSIEYLVPNPSSGSKNVEGFALSPKYSNNSQVNAWFCRDVSSSSESADCLRWFYPFNSTGENIVVSGVKETVDNSDFVITISQSKLKIQYLKNDINNIDITLYAANGQKILTRKNRALPYTEYISLKGVCYISISKNNHILVSKKILAR